jgi:hypothetical protein
MLLDGSGDAPETNTCSKSGSEPLLAGGPSSSVSQSPINSRATGTTAWPCTVTMWPLAAFGPAERRGDVAVGGEADHVGVDEGLLGAEIAGDS